MEQYLVASDFAGTGLVPYLSAISTAIPPFWPLTLFILWVVINASSYFAILKLTGKKRFWHTLTSVSFVFFLLALVVTGMNTVAITFLSGYWVGFYILMTVISWMLLEKYK